MATVIDKPEVLKITDLSAGYKKDRLALKELNFSAKSGEVIALTGGNGEGKTTLARVLRMENGKICEDYDLFHIAKKYKNTKESLMT
ncbi:hypothetical protein AZF37_02080 [endosymbiont 'TC1' of Trimyema compressum]|nr:hypothetical protein AZF37_02080 [endosymbiont 'TC1' of Trimyema compressum]